MSAIGGSSSVGRSTIGELSGSTGCFGFGRRRRLCVRATAPALAAALPSSSAVGAGISRFSSSSDVASTEALHRFRELPRRLPHRPRGVRVRVRRACGGGACALGDRLRLRALRRLALERACRLLPRLPPRPPPRRSRPRLFFLDRPRLLTRGASDRAAAPELSTVIRAPSKPSSITTSIDDPVALLDVGELGALLVEHIDGSFAPGAKAGSARPVRAPPRPR